MTPAFLSRSRVKLLPHQLWVCRRVLERWPSRWLVADDVGLGKTVEAGLILTPLLARGTVRRLLITPAARGTVAVPPPRHVRHPDGGLPPRTRHGTVRLLGTHPLVVASYETLREDRGGRHGRLVEAEPWDLLFVYERIG